MIEVTAHKIGAIVQDKGSMFYSYFETNLEIVCIVVNREQILTTPFDVTTDNEKVTCEICSSEIQKWIKNR